MLALECLVVTVSADELTGYFAVLLDALCRGTASICAWLTIQLLMERQFISGVI